MRMRLHHCMLLAVLALFLSLGQVSVAAAGQANAKPASTTTFQAPPITQSDEKSTPKPGPIETSVGHGGDVRPIEAVGEIENGYVPLTFDYMVKLYWRFGNLSPDDNTAVIEYIRNTECGLFQKYVKDDFKWPEVVSVTREYLRKYAGQLSGKISIVQPIALDKYNPAKGWFNLTADSQYLNVSQLEIADYTSGKYYCGNSTEGRSKTIPLQARVKLASPFSITYLPMEYSFAQDYLKWVDKNRMDPIIIKGAAHDRYAFVNFQIEINGLSPRKNADNLWEPALFIGRLDRYDVYADRALTLPLHHWINDR